MTVTYPSTNRARRSVTSIMRRTTLAARPRHQHKHACYRPRRRLCD